MGFEVLTAEVMKSYELLLTKFHEINDLYL
jgi:hypothetical protein